MIQSCKAKAPFRYGIRVLKRKDLNLPEVNTTDASKTPAAAEEVKQEPVIEAPAAEEVKQEPVIEAPAAEEVKQEEISGTTLESAGFSAASIRNLGANSIQTIEQLTAYLDTGATLEALDKVGAKSAKIIEEELNAWLERS